MSIDRLSSTYIRTSLFLLLFTAFALAATPLATAEESGVSTNSANNPSSSVLSSVDHKYVCMITNQRFDKEQIPVTIDGKTYYGCCEKCKAKLRDNPDTRLAVDPVSGKVVDKALSIIGVAPDGKAYYFENKKNLRLFKGSLNTKN